MMKRTGPKPAEALSIAKAVFHTRYAGATFAYAAGSIMRGEGTYLSDIDLVVISDRLDAARRESFIVDGVPIEAFFHDPETLAWFADAWQRYVREKLTKALNSRSAWFLFGLSFVVVYREVFETILFYAAIWTQGNGGAVLAGAVSAVAVLAVVAWATMRYSRTLPIGKFFAYSSALMALLAVVLIGKGVSALQEAGWLPVNPVAGFPRVEILGLYPTTEGIAAQLVIAPLLAIGFGRNRVTAGNAKGVTT